MKPFHNVAPTGPILLHQQPYSKLLNAFKSSECFIHAGGGVHSHSGFIRVHDDDEEEEELC